MENIKSSIHDAAKDVRINLDSILKSTVISQDEAAGCAIAAAMTARDSELARAFHEFVLGEDDVKGAIAAASLMGMTNVWYSFTDLADQEIASVPPRLRMLAYASKGGVSERKFEMWTLAASVIGKCKSCISAHIEGLRKIGATSAEIAEVARIASIINATSIARQGGI